VASWLELPIPQLWRPAGDVVLDCAEHLDVDLRTSTPRAMSRRPAEHPFEAHDAPQGDVAGGGGAYGPVDETDGPRERSNGINGGVVDNAIYVDGVRTANPVTLDETYELLRERHGMACSGCTVRPRGRSDQLRPNSGCTIWSSMMPSPPTNGPSWSGTARATSE
jgi:hypothetical protein